MSIKVSKYRTKPGKIEAIRLKYSSFTELDTIKNFCPCLVLKGEPYSRFFLPTLTLLGDEEEEESIEIEYGDYIVKGLTGEFYPCKSGLFEQTYKEARWAKKSK